MEKHFKVWAFDDAPQEYRDLSTNGGDEDFVFELPEGMIQSEIPFGVGMMIERATICDCDWYRAPNGRTIAITCHA